MIFTRKFLKICVAVIVLLTIFNIVYIFKNKSVTENLSLSFNAFKSFSNSTNEKISWEDWEWIKYEKSRVGPGENGEPYVETDPELIKKNEEWVKKEGFWVEVSNKISVTRSLSEHRPAICPQQKYFENLPNVSVIVTFHNEIPSTLIRCIHSIYNRSPKHLLHEIVLINDKSTFPELYENLRKYVTEMFGSKIKLIENEERQGLIKARMTGAKAATGEVIIFLDSHMEVFNTWLPPLLDSIVTHPESAAVPVCDGMDHKTFQPVHTGYGYRGVFDWNFRYQWLPLRPQDRKVEGAPYELAAMTGGSYAIRRDLFFHLGGYDEGLLIWNGENYELSLKLWLCAGGLYEIPCSRVTHLSKLHSAYRQTEKPMDFVGRNLKRVAEVWLDEYKQYFYRGEPKRYEKIDAGDLTKQFEKKKSLNCKPFKYFLDVVAPDMLLRYPIEPKYFANGVIQSESTKKCLGLPQRKYTDHIGLIECSQKGGNDFVLSLEKSLKYNDTNDQCLNSGKLDFSNCHHQFGGQHWKFDIDSRQIINPQLRQCLTANISTKLVDLLPCDVNLPDQKWRWGFENKTALMDWDKSGVIIG